MLTVLYVGAGGRVGAHAGEYDSSERMAALTVAAGVEAVAGDFPRLCGDRGGGAQVRPGRLGAQPAGVVPRRDEQQRRGMPAGLSRRGRPARGMFADEGVLLAMVKAISFSG
jgi:hypothetical protein